MDVNVLLLLLENEMSLGHLWFFFLFLVGFSKPDAELVFASIAESNAFGSFLVFFLCRVAFSKPPIGLSDPRTSFSLDLDAFWFYSLILLLCSYKKLIV